MAAYRQLQPVASHRGDDGDEASQCNEQPGDLDEQSPDLRGETTQEGHGPIRARIRDLGFGLVMPSTMAHHYHATVE
jgi:hypothetical protein